MSDPRPTVTEVTDRFYGSLPEVYRDADAAQDTGASNYPLLRYLATLLDQLQPLADLVTRVTYVPMDERGDLPSGNALEVPSPWQRFGTGTLGDDTFGDADTSDLVDPTTADAGWLAWLAQLLGVNIAGLSLADARALLFNPADSWAHGTPAAIAREAREARRQLDPDDYVDVRPHFEGDPFTIVVITKASETYGTTTWGDLEQTAPTWADLEALGSWSAAESAPVMIAASSERPAGYRLVHAYLEDLAP